MGLRLVNTSPGETTDAVKPGQFASLGLKSETLKVPLASTFIAMGLTNVEHHNILPKNDTVLPDLGATVTLETSERRRPVGAETPENIVSNSLVFTKSNMALNELGIYEIKMPIAQRQSCLAYFKFRTRTAWTTFTPDWLNLSDMTGMYFGLEHGTFNTAIYAFLRNHSAGGSMVLGGPLPAFNTVRPNQIELAPGVPHAATPGFAWATPPNNSVAELYLFFNVEGYEVAPATGVPVNVPMVEVWTKLPADSAPVVQAYIPVGALGQFPSSLPVGAFTNSRPGISDTATIFFGNISKTSGSDDLVLDDWAFFPDFRLAVNEGVERPNHNLLAMPDAPAEYRADSNKTPFELIPGRWFADTSGVPPRPTLFYQPGHRENATYVSLPKDIVGTSAIHRTEPRFEQRQDGIMVEAFLAGVVNAEDGDGTGMGFSVEDGQKTYQVMMVGNPQRKFYGLVKDLLNLSSMSLGYYIPATDADYTSLKMIRLLVDRRRPGGGKVDVMVDDVVVVSEPLSSTFPASSSATGLVRVGQLGLPNAIGQVNLGILNYLPRYLAWEGVDTLTPDNGGLDAQVKFTLSQTGGGGHSMVGTNVEIQKTASGGSNHYTFVNNQDFGEVDGMLLDWQVQIETYTDLGGQVFASNTPVGATMTVYLGNKKVEIGFYDCGVHGKMVAILPSSGDVNDIINQTDIGSPLSFPLDWTQMNQFRLVVKGHDRIDLTIGAKTDPVSISLKWRNDTDGFDLPEDISTPRIVFGHSYFPTTSKSLWSFVRWGMSNGFEIAVQQEYPNGYPKALFGGRALFKSVFDEA